MDNNFKLDVERQNIEKDMQQKDHEKALKTMKYQHDLN